MALELYATEMQKPYGRAVQTILPRQRAARTHAEGERQTWHSTNLCKNISPLYVSMPRRVAAQARTTLTAWATLITVLLHHFRLNTFDKCNQVSHRRQLLQALRWTRMSESSGNSWMWLENLVYPEMLIPNGQSPSVLANKRAMGTTNVDIKQNRCNTRFCLHLWF